MSDTTGLAQRSAHALGWNWAGSAARALVQFVVQVALARLLGPEAFGQAAAVLLVVGFGWLLAEAGLGAALIQQTSLSDDDVACALGWVLLLSALVALAVVALAAPLAALLGDARATPLVRASAALIPLQALSNLPLSLMQRRFQAKRLQAIQVLAYVVSYGGVGVLMAWQGQGAWSLLAAFALHAVIVMLLCWAAVRHTLAPCWRGHAALRAYGAKSTVANVVNWAMESIDRAVISRGWGAAGLGQYTLAATLARAPVMLLVGSLQPVAFAAASRLQAEPQRLARGYLAVLALGLLVTVPLSTFLALHATAVVALLYGPLWIGAAAPFVWLCAGVPFFMMLALTGPMLRGVGAVVGEARAQLVVLMLLFAVLLGLMGQPLALAAMAVCAATALRAALLFQALTAHVPIALAALWRAWRGALALGVLVLLMSMVGREWMPGELAAAAVSAVLSALACLALLRWRARAFLGAELTGALMNRQGDSRAAAVLCLCLRLGSR